MNDNSDYVEGEYGTYTDLRLGGFNPQENIGLINWTCGYGKSFFATDTSQIGLLQSINRHFGKDIQPMETLFLTTRHLIEAQQEQEYGDRLVRCDRIDDLALPVYERHIRCMTYHRFGKCLLDGEKVPPTVKLIILDEAHSLFTDDFAGETPSIVKEWLSQATGTIRIFLTATPQPLEWLSGDTIYQQKCREQFGFAFKNVARRTRPRYHVGNIKVVTGRATPATLVKVCRGRGIVFVYSAQEAYRLSQQTPNSMFIVSKYSDRTDKYGNLLKDQMNIEAIEHIKRTGEFPEGIDTVFATSAFREGIDLHEHIDYMIIQGIEPHNIIQCLGRVRVDVPLVYAVTEHTENNYIKMVKSSRSVLQRIEDNPEEEQYILEEYYRAEQRNRTLKSNRQPYEKNMGYFVFKSLDGTYKIDWSMFCYWLYKQICYIADKNYHSDAIYLDRHIPDRQTYYSNIFADYSDNIEFIYWTKDMSTQVTIDYRKRQIPDIVKPYVGKKIYKGDAIETYLLDAIQPVDKQGRATRSNKQRRNIMWDWIDKICDVEHKKDNRWFHRILLST